MSPRFRELFVLIACVGALPSALAAQSLAQQAYLKASNTGEDDRFGLSVSVSGNQLVVGAPLESSAAVVVDGDQSSDAAPLAGAAYVFRRTGPNWTQRAYLKASNTGASDLFGTDVAISGDTLVVGARGEGSAATGVDGDSADDSAVNAGAAYVFVRSGDTWVQQAYLKASNTDANDVFGESVAISGDTLVIGATSESSAATGVNGDDSDDSAASAGAAYVFVRTGSTWTQQAYLKASNTQASDLFGCDVAISGDTIVVGASGEDGPGESASLSGAAYVFTRSGTTWTQQAYLKASNADAIDRFGDSVAIDLDTLVVGARFEDSGATGVNGAQGDNSVNSAGAAYVFVRTGSAWTQQAYLKASVADGSDLFGLWVAVDGDAIAVSAPFEDSSATGIDGSAADNGADTAGAVSLFRRTGTTWAPQAYVKASNTGAVDHFGESLGLSGDVLVVGASLERSGATGVDGDQSDDSVPEAGAAYVFHNVPGAASAFVDQGGALAGVNGDPQLVGSGTLVDGANNSVALSSAAPLALTGVFVALSSSPVAFKGGSLQAFPFVLLRFFSTGGEGDLTLPFVMPSDAPLGTQLWVQAAIQDVVAPSGVALSNALLGVTQ